MPFINEPLRPGIFSDLTKRTSVTTDVPVHHEGTGTVDFDLQQLKDATGKVLVDFRKSFFSGWVSEYWKLRRQVPTGRIARLSIYEKNGAALQSKTITTSFIMTKYKFRFEVPELPMTKVWTAKIENLTDHHLFFWYEISKPGRKEDRFMSIDPAIANDQVNRQLSELSMILDTEHDSTIDIPLGGPPPIHFGFPLPPVEVPELGATVSINDIRSIHTGSRYEPDAGAPSGLALVVDLEFENEGPEGRMHFWWDRTVDIENLRLTVAFPLIINSGRVRYDFERLGCTADFDDFDVSGFPDTVYDISDKVKIAIQNAVRGALSANAVRTGIEAALTALFPRTTGVSVISNDVIGAERVDGKLRLRLITTHDD